jgi:hypothetical protein
MSRLCSNYDTLTLRIMSERKSLMYTSYVYICIHSFLVTWQKVTPGATGCIINSFHQWTQNDEFIRCLLPSKRTVYCQIHDSTHREVFLTLGARHTQMPLRRGECYYSVVLQSWWQRSGGYRKRGQHSLSEALRIKIWVQGHLEKIYLFGEKNFRINSTQGKRCMSI